MKALFLISAVMLAQPAFAEKVCWDGTFGYNYARAVVTDKGLEISIEGNTLKLPPLSPDSGQSLTFGGFSGLTPHFHVVIPKASVIENSGTLTAEISGGIADSFEGRIPALWVQHNVLDLDSTVNVLTPIPLLGVKAKVSEESVQLSFTQLWGYTKKGDNLTSTVKVNCSIQSAPEDLQVPERLQQFLSKASS